ncbi:MAG: DUF1449 family protein [Planctomycetes bacterium]|nr:DUF1449 family protein [Planctomycetota bacterium]
MNPEFLFQSYNVFFTFVLLIGGINMLNKVLGTILKVFTRPDFRNPVKTSEESIETNLDKKEIENIASISVDFKKLRKIPLIHHFINISTVSPMFVINLLLFTFGISGLLISYAIFEKGKELTIVDFLVCLTASAFVALVSTKIITFVYAKLFPTFNSFLFPRDNLIGLPAWVLMRKGNLYLCQVVEPCGQTFKIEVALPLGENTPKLRASVILTKYNVEDDYFEGEFIENEEALRIFNAKEGKVFSTIRQEHV